MEHEFWHDKWQTNEIGFHLSTVNPFLAKCASTHLPKTGSRIFLPLCGKTRDIAWLLDLGYQVAGAELSELAIQQLFQDLEIQPKSTRSGNLTHHKAPNLDIYTGDIFDLTQTQLGPIQATFDRAALVALPKTTRPNYARHLTQITQTAPQFLITFTYDQAQMNGPPFSVPKDEIERLYSDHYTIEEIESTNVQGGLKGKCPAIETAWALKGQER